MITLLLFLGINNAVRQDTIFLSEFLTILPFVSVFIQEFVIESLQYNVALSKSSGPKLKIQGELVCLLNSILNGYPYIKSVKLEPTEYKKTSANGKSIRLDIAATSDDGTILNIEVQCSNEGSIVDHANHGLNI